MAKKTKIEKSKLERTLEFMDMVHKAGTDQSIYCNIESGLATAFNLVVGVGARVDEDLCAVPHTGLFLAALARCGERYAITQLSPEKLLVRSGDFHAYIPCVHPDACLWATPDAKAGQLNEGFIQALAKVAPLASTTGEAVLDCSIQLNNGSVIATDRCVIAEAWHGCEFPQGLLLPRSSFNLLKKAKRKIVAFGFSATSVTFYFEDDSWFFSKLFDERAVDIAHQFAYITPNVRDVPNGFFEAVKKVAPFSGDGRIYVFGNKVSSHPFGTAEEGSGLSLPFDDVSGHQHRIYSSDALAYAAHYATQWDESARKDATLFYGDDLRGLLHHDTPLTRNESTGVAPSDDEDIPF